MPVLSAKHDSLPRTSRRGQYALVGVVAIVAGALLWLGLPLLDVPSTVDLTVENPGPYDVDIDVRRPGDNKTLGLGTTETGTAREFHKVIDRGDTWIFEFSSAGVDAGSMEADRDDLADDGWRVVIPDRAADELRTAGVETPPAPTS